MTAWGRLPPVSGCLYKTSLLGLVLSLNLPFMAWTGPDPGAAAYGEVRPKEDICRFMASVSDEKADIPFVQ